MSTSEPKTGSVLESKYTWLLPVDQKGVSEALASPTELQWRKRSQLCVNNTMLFSLQMGERLSTAPSSDLESEFGTPLPRVEQNVDDISLNRAQHRSIAFSGWTGARPSKYCVRPWREQLEARMNWAEWGAGL